VSETAAALTGSTAMTWRYPSWYRELADAVNKAVGKLMTASITPTEFVEQVEAVVTALRHDPSTRKYQRA